MRNGAIADLYAESSAVLAWLLGEPESGTLAAALTDADHVVTSDLTIVECDRGLIRAQLGGRLRGAEAPSVRRTFQAAANGWDVLRISPAIVERARRPFPGDPIRTLDALHLATALAAAQTSDDFALLSLDRRVRTSARALGLEVLPTKL